MKRAPKDSRFRSPSRPRGCSRILLLNGIAIGLFASFVIIMFVVHGGKDGQMSTYPVAISLKDTKGELVQFHLDRSSISAGVDSAKGKLREATGKKEAETIEAPKSLAIPEGLDDGEKEMLAGIEEIRAIKKSGRAIEQDREAQTKIPTLQKRIRTYLLNKYGPGPYMIEMEITLPDYLTAPVNAGGGKHTRLLIEMAPIEYVPYTNYFFLAHVVSRFKKGNFHRNAGHVLQAMLNLKEGLKHTHFAWQEYSPMFAHQRYTMGFAGRPGGSAAIYVSTVDNIVNHGPGSQGSKTEADVCWGKLADQASIDVVEVMKKQKGGSKESGFIDDSGNFISIDSIRLVPTELAN